MNKSRNVLAIILITIGLIMLLSRYVYLPDGFNGLIVGAGFLAGYLISGNDYVDRKSGLLTAGSIIVALAMHNILNEIIYMGIFQGVMVCLFVGIAFFSIHFISSGKTEKSGVYVQSWALRSGVISFIIGGIIFVMTMLNWSVTAAFINNIWPVGLIIAGLVIILNNYKKEK